MKIGHMLKIFLPALFLLGLIFFVRIIQYEPLYPEVVTSPTTEDSVKKAPTIPIYPEDIIIGLKNASKTLIVFGDFGCENCKMEYELLHQIIKENPTKLKVIWKGLPVTTFPYSTELANTYAFCAAKQEKFEIFAELAFANSTSLNEQTLDALIKETDIDLSDIKTCIHSQQTTASVQKTKDIAEALGIQSVPTVFFNNVQVNTPTSIEEWKGVLAL